MYEKQYISHWQKEDSPDGSTEAAELSTSPPGLCQVASMASPKETCPQITLWRIDMQVTLDSREDTQCHGNFTIKQRRAKRGNGP